MYSVQIAVSDGTLTRISLNIEYFEKDDITLYRNLGLTPLVLGTDWQWDGDTAINLLTATPVPAGEYITVRRNTNINRAYNIYDGGSAFSRETLDENFKQMIYLAQEFTEGNGLTGLFFPLNMRGFKITNLGDGTEPEDAVNKGQLDVVDDRVSNLEQAITVDNISYPWYTKTTAPTDVITPPLAFTKCTLDLNGISQIPGYSYIVVDNQILLAEEIPAGTLVFARLGEVVGLDPDYATADQLGEAVSNLELAQQDLVDAVDGKAGKGANSDITSLSGLTTPLSVAQGGTGSNTAADARTSLGATLIGDAVFTAASAAAARSSINAAVSGSNSDITALTGLSGGISGLTNGVAAGTGIVGQEVSQASAATTNLTSGTNANLVSISLPAGDWELESAVRLNNAGNVTLLNFGVSTTSATLPTDWWDKYNITTTLAAGTSTRQGMSRRVLLSAPTTLYLVVQSTFTSTCTADGYIRARRVR